MKKSVSLICSIALLAAAIPFSACSNDAQVNYTLSEDGTHYIVSGVSGNKRALKSYDVLPEYSEVEGGEPLPVTEIGRGAFMECTLYRVTIPDSIEIIGANAFTFCSFSEFTIPEGVTTIGYGAFGQCTALTQIVIPESVTSIQPLAFAYCSKLTSVTIKGAITELPVRAFYNSYSVFSGNVYTDTSLVSITLPATLQKIHVSALDGNFLEDIYFAGSEQQWDELYFFDYEKDEDAEGDEETYVEKKVEKSAALPSGVKIHFNSEGE